MSGPTQPKTFMITIPLYACRVMVQKGGCQDAFLKKWERWLGVKNDWMSTGQVEAGVLRHERFPGMLGLYFREPKPEPEIIAHECCHLAIRMLDRIGAKGLGIGDHEEPFAYLVEWLFKKVAAGRSNG